MARRALPALVALGGALLLAALAAAAWWAWERGLVPGNPRAVSAEAMRPALLRHLVTTPRGAQGGCLAPDLSSPRPEVEGREGVAQRALPGQFTVSLLLQVGEREQRSRDRQIAQMSYLAREGFFTEAEAIVFTDAGPRPARRYVFTWKGYAEAGPALRGPPCLRIGEPAFDAIESFERQRQRLAGIEVWSVAYRTRVRDLPAWAATEEARALFPGLRGRAEPARGRAFLLRGGGGWLSQGEARLQLLDPRMTTASAARHIDELRERAAAPALEPEAARAALEAYLAGGGWAPRAAACLPVRLAARGDERGGAPDEKGVRITYYDLPPATRPAYARAQMVSTLHLLHALEAAGLARSRPSGPGVVLVGRAKIRASSGVRYELPPEALDALGVGRGNPCIPAGRLQVEMLSARTVAPGLAQLHARARVLEPTALAQRLARELPALELALAEGVPVSGQLALGERGWHVTALEPHYPQIRADSVPQSLRRLLPQTEAAHPVVPAP